MSLRQSQSVSEIVENFRKHYPDTERKALRKLILLQHRGINQRTLDRHLKKTFERDTLELDKTCGQKPQQLPYHRVGLWDRLQHDLKQEGADLVEIDVQKATYTGRDPETGWRQFNYDKKGSIEGVMVLKGATKLVAAARSAGIYIGNEYGGIVLTSDPIEYKYSLWWKEKLYEVKNVEERYDGYNFSHHIAYLDELIPNTDGKEIVGVHMPSIVDDGRSQTKAFLTSYLNDANIVKDDGSTKATYAVIYADPDYDILGEEFQASIDPVDGLYVIGESETIPLRSADQEVCRYEERVPVSIFTINRFRVRGIKLKRTMETELRRTCETHPNGIYRTLEKIRVNDRRLENIVLYSTEYVLNYQRPRTSKL